MEIVTTARWQSLCEVDCLVGVESILGGGGLGERASRASPTLMCCAGRVCCRD